MGIVEDVQKRYEQQNNRVCKFCGRSGADKEYLGSYWHSDCLEKARAAGRLN